MPRRVAGRSPRPEAQVTQSRLVVVWGQLAARAALHGGGVSVADVCAVAAGSAQLAGAWVAAARDGRPEFVMCVTDSVCEQLAELQLMLGEGPCREVLASASPVLAADLGEEEFGRRWPAFAPAARRLGAGALFVFPLIVGAIHSGVMALYRRSPGPLPDGRLGDLLILADVATVLLLDGADHGAAGSAEARGVVFDGQAPDLAVHRAEIDQATGMLMVQLGVPAGQAFVRLRAYAYVHDRRLADVAGDIVGRRLRLDADPVQEGDA
jgi:hypothetical protein